MTIILLFSSDNEETDCRIHSNCVTRLSKTVDPIKFTCSRSRLDPWNVKELTLAGGHIATANYNAN